jgi:hypothetical protein
MDGVSTTAGTVWDFQLSCLSEEDRKYTYEIPYCQYMCVDTSFQLLNYLTDLQETWCEHRAIGIYQNIFQCNILKQIIINSYVRTYEAAETLASRNSGCRNGVVVKPLTDTQLLVE